MTSSAWVSTLFLIFLLLSSIRINRGWWALIKGLPMAFLLDTRDFFFGKMFFHISRHFSTTGVRSSAHSRIAKFASWAWAMTFVIAGDYGEFDKVIERMDDLKRRSGDEN